MKKVVSIIPLIAFSILLFTNCSSDENIEDKTSESFVELNLDFYQKSSKDSHLIEEFAFTDGKSSSTDPIFKILYDTNTEGLNKILFSEKYLSENDISKDVLEDEFNKLHTESKSDPNEPELSEHASCIEACKDRYTDDKGNKIKGRGACKGNCWVDTGIRIVEALTTIVKL